MHALLMATCPPTTLHRNAANAVDRFGAIASSLCAIHCMVLPFVLALLPALGLSFLADHGFERCFVAFASVLASWSLLSSYRRHRRPQPLWLLLPGLTLLWSGAFVVDEHYGLAIHAVLVAMGGALLASAHLTNLRFARDLGYGPECGHSTR
jgi:hypothetical protein